jgi:hypothetical protein
VVATTTRRGEDGVAPLVGIVGEGLVGRDPCVEQLEQISTG